MRTKQTTVSEYLIRTLGVKRAGTVMLFVSLWSMFRAAHGRDPERIEELADEIGRSRSTVFRWQEMFREVLPQYSTPGDLLDAAHVQRERVLASRAVGQLRIAVTP